jgi:hypothetical protein
MTLLNPRVAIACAVSVACLLTGCMGDNSHDSIYQQQISLINEAFDVCKTVKDEASAKQAETKLRSINVRLKELAEKEKSLGEPPQQERTNLNKKFNAQMTSTMKRMFEQYPGEKNDATRDAFREMLEIKAQLIFLANRLNCKLGEFSPDLEK